jgi:hypothetical protein
LNLFVRVMDYRHQNVFRPKIASGKRTRSFFAQPTHARRSAVARSIARPFLPRTKVPGATPFLNAASTPLSGTPRTEKSTNAGIEALHDETKVFASHRPPSSISKKMSRCARPPSRRFNYILPPVEFIGAVAIPPRRCPGHPYRSTLPRCSPALE